jgi:hypothetical protein
MVRLSNPRTLLGFFVSDLAFLLFVFVEDDLTALASDIRLRATTSHLLPDVLLWL